MLAAGLGAVLTCVDPRQLSERFVGRRYGETLLAELQPGSILAGSGASCTRSATAARIGQISLSTPATAWSERGSGSATSMARRMGATKEPGHGANRNG